MGNSWVYSAGPWDSHGFLMGLPVAFPCDNSARVGLHYDSRECPVSLPLVFYALT